ncbi:hypothetical protein LCGC14_2867800 [marine sediment metagenome]|uniref:Peptidase S1 domain-containing protein n=1 Tax=marine sediment metagenome TaxID=412755 RepID=A0A0F9AC23_9ZZZZ
MLAFRNTLLLAVLTVGLFAQSSHAIMIHDGANEADYIAYGNTFPSNGYVLPYIGEQAYWGSSAVVIDDGHWVLFSGHQALIDNNNPSTLYDQYVFGTGQNALSDPGSLYTATEIFVHPDYGGVYHSDLTLLYFEDAITDVTPAVRYRGELQVGELLSIVGSGSTGTGSSGYVDGGFQRRGCENVFDSFNIGGMFPDYTLTTYFVPLGDPDYRPLGGLTGPGDSGGGWYNNDGLLVGIHTGGTGPGYHTASIGTGLYEFNGWIDGVQATVPEPSSLVMLFTGVVWLCLLRRRRSA